MKFNIYVDLTQWGFLVFFFYSKCRVCVKSIYKKRWGSTHTSMSLDWQTDIGDAIIQWWHDSLATHFMVMNNQKSFYRWHIKEHLVYALVNPIDYFVISPSLTCSSVLYLSYKCRIFWLDKLLYRNNPIKGMQCCVSCQWQPLWAVALETIPCRVVING